jgi:hypothetical protein
MAAKRVIKVKNPMGLAQPEPQEQPQEQPQAQAEPEPQPQKQKRSIKVKKGLPVPPPQSPNAPYSKAAEAFEMIREYYAERDEPIPDEDIKWFHEEIKREEAETTHFWEDCNVTKAIIDAAARGATEDEIWIAEAAAKLIEKKRPLTQSDIGEMPEYGTREFWAWCNKRKQLRLEKEAAIIAAGGTVKPQKEKKPKVPKVPKAQKT